MRWCCNLHSASFRCILCVNVAQHPVIVYAAMQKARYDKIQHVRSAAERALRALQALAAQYHHSHVAAASGNCFPAESQRWCKCYVASASVSVCCCLTHSHADRRHRCGMMTAPPHLSRPRSALHRGRASAHKSSAALPSGGSKAVPTARRSLAPRVSASEELDFGVQVCHERVHAGRQKRLRTIYSGF
jgi:hypothetical protein